MCIFAVVKFLKHVLAFSLALIFFVSVSGINVYKHYCGDFLAETSVYIQSNPCAGEDGEDACSKNKETSCCDDEIEFHQLDIDLVQTSIQKVSFSERQFEAELFESLQFYTEIRNQKEGVAERAPPDVNEIPIYKRLNRYTLYG